MTSPARENIHQAIFSSKDVMGCEQRHFHVKKAKREMQAQYVIDCHKMS